MNPQVTVTIRWLIVATCGFAVNFGWINADWTMIIVAVGIGFLSLCWSWRSHTIAKRIASVTAIHPDIRVVVPEKSVEDVPALIPVVEKEAQVIRRMEPTIVVRRLRTELTDVHPERPNVIAR